jgi:hypothetical protein
MTAVAEIKPESTQDKVEMSWKFVEAQRLQGYKIETAMADLVDNSIDANADKIQVKLQLDKDDKLDKIIIADNGSGMDWGTLKESYNLGARTPHANSDLGKFGVGGTLGSIALAKSKLTLTKNHCSDIMGRELDLDKCKDENTFFSSDYTPSTQEIKMFNEIVGRNNTGTLIVLSNLDKVSAKGEKKVKRIRDKLIMHFGTTYYQHLSSNSFKILINGVELEPKDPVCWFHPNVIKLASGKIVHEGVTYNIKCADLSEIKRNEITFSNLDKSQGIYLERNNRIIVRAQANGGKLGDGFWIKHPNWRYFRALISFDASADEQIGLTTDKASINIHDQGLLDKFRAFINPHAAAVSKKARERELSSTEDERRKDLDNAQEVYNKKIIQPKQQQRNNTKSDDSNVENISSKRNKDNNKSEKEDIKYKIEEVAEGNRGSFARFDSITNTVNLNVEHPYMSSFYVDASKETREAVIHWVVSLLYTELEMGKYESSQLECNMDDFFDDFQSRLSHACRNR